MDIKSASYYRYRYMIDDRHCKADDNHNLAFVGHEFLNAAGEYEKGYFDLVHGDKSDIRNFIAQHLKNAEDGQAIYEFLQNAEDAKASTFMAFYNEEYFLAVNNGSAFTRNGVRAILNVAQSDKKDSSLIGRFGIGFKLVHRLVGEGEGLDELLKDYCGPILFSWDREDDLVQLMQNAPVNPVQDVSDDSSLPYLFKILITSFPAGVGEKILDIEHNERIGFTQEEYEEVSIAVKNNLEQYISQGFLSSGSLFYIKLGKGKKEKLDNNFETELKVGVEYSLNTLSHIQNVIINGTTINKVSLTLEKGTIEKGSEQFAQICPEYKDSDIHFSVGYKVDFNAEDPLAAAEGLKASPTFYKFFPLGDEIHSSALFIHCDALSNQTNRRKLQDDNTNQTLLPEIAKFIDAKLSSFQSSKNWEAFRELYASILLTDTAHDNSAWLNSCFFDLLPGILKKYIPVIEPDGTISYIPDAKNVKIRRIKSNVPLSVVNDDLRWFAWGQEFKELIKRAKDKEKIGLEYYDICDLIKEADVIKLNAWIESADNEEYEVFLNEINEADETKLDAIKSKLLNIKLFKFSDGLFYSRADLVRVNTNMQSVVRVYIQDPIVRIFITPCLHGLEGVLSALGIEYSEKNLGDFKGLEGVITLPINEHVFYLISERVKAATLSLEDKRTLIARLSDNSFSGVGPERIARLYMCDNNKGERLPLSKLVGKNYPGYEVPEWLKPYQIKDDDYFKELDSYLLKREDIFATLIHPRWDELKVTNNNTVIDFYTDVCALFEVANDKKSMRGLRRIFTERGDYQAPGCVLFYSSLASNETVNYTNLAEGAWEVFGISLPKKELIALLKERPFEVQERRLSACSPTDNSTSASNIEAIIKTAILNNESFFNMFSVTKTDAGFIIKKSNLSCPQAYTDNSEVLKFISDNFKDRFTLLPKGFSSYSESNGILQKEALYQRLLKVSTSVFDDVKESLIDIIKYDSVKVDFLLKINSLALDLDKSPEDNPFIIKAFKMAANLLKSELRSEEKRKLFRDHISFIKGGFSTPLTSIPTSASSVFRCNGAKKDFDLAKLLPNQFGNGSLLKEAVNLLQNEGISILDINTLLGISDSPDQDEIYAKMKAHYTVFENTQQLAFSILKEGNGSIDNSGIQAYDKSGKTNKGAFVVANHSFIKDSYNLDSRYCDLGDYIQLPTANNTFIKDCYINDGTFIAGCLETTDNNVRDYDKTIDLLEYLYTLHITDKDSFKKVNWSSIKDAIGFDPATCAYPLGYATESERIPSRIDSWAGQKEGIIEFFCDLGMLTPNMTEMKFRKYMNGESVPYSDTDIFSCQNVERLEKSLEWLESKALFPVSEEKKGYVLKAVEQINKLRKNIFKGDIIVTESFDFNTIKESSVEYDGSNYASWKEETGISIFLYNGPLPKTVSLDEYLSSVAVKYVSDANITDNKEDKAIYINSLSDLKAELHVLAKNNTIGLTNEMVYKLFDAEIVGLRAELEFYKKIVALGEFGEAKMDAQNPNDRDKKDQIEDNVEAREIVMDRLLNEGYIFENGIGQYSTMRGVKDPDGNPVTIVVKSAINGLINIHPNDWADLLTPRAQLWIRTHEGTYPIHLREMIRQQDILSLKIDTSNLDTAKGVAKIATLLKWMRAIHFDFKSIMPTHIAKDYHEYAFDDRPMDEQLSSDDFSA